MNELEVSIAIAEECNNIRDMLQEKNRKYGNSALAPIGIFHQGNPIDAIDARIDDKLNRIKNRNGNDDEDPILDLIGYLILRRVVKNLTV